MKRGALSQASCLAFGAVLVSSSARAEEPFYLPPGDLLPASGTGLAETTVFAPGMRYPLEQGPSFPNSQVYMNGGSMGPAGHQCDTVNYSYPWRDNYCEKRSWDMPLCPAGIGHQGQDVRPATCENKKHQVVATAAGQVTNIGTYSIYVTTPSGQRFDYLHGALDTIVVTLGQQVEVGQPLVKVSNNMGDTPTSIHLHFNLKQDVGGVGFVYVSPYMSLVEAYKELMGLGNKAPGGVFDEAACEQLRGWAQDPDDPEAAVTVDLYFGGAKGDPFAVPVQVEANLYREDLCQVLGTCEHAFELEVPLSLRDGLPHPIFAYANDSQDGEAAEMELSPSQIQCAPPPIPAGVRRWIVDPESLAAWKFSPFWQAIQAAEPDVVAIPQSLDLGQAPLLARSEADPAKVWLIDQGFRRLVSDDVIAAAWGFDLAAAELWASAELQALPEATPVRPMPVLLKGTGPAIYLLDDPLCDPQSDTIDPLCPEHGTTSGTGTNGSSSSSGDVTAPINTGSGSSDGGGGAPALPDGYGQDAGSGCGCAQGSAGLGGLALGALLLGRRRRTYLDITLHNIHYRQ